MKRTNQHHPNKFNFFLLLIVTTLLLISCAFPKETSWNNSFISYFNPSQTIIKEMDRAVQNVYSELNTDKVTVRVNQTLGDQKTIFISLDVTFPNDINLEPILSMSNNSNAEVQIMPESVEIIEGKIDYKDVEGHSMAQVASVYGKSVLNGNTDVYTSGVNLENNSISYIICFDGNNVCFDGGEITLLISGFVQNFGEETEIISQGPYVVSWLPKNEGEILSSGINTEDGKNIGSVILSAFSLRAELYLSDYNSDNELLHSVKLVLKNGNVIELNGPSSVSFEPATGAGTVKAVFQKILDLENVVSLQIGGYTINL
jgi:hypothetical protein